MLDLQQFCSTDETRPYLMKPFSRDGFTWATNGHIMVRVPQRTDVPDVDKKFKPARPLEGIETATFYKPAFNLPPAPTETGPCPVCEGRGQLHDCPDCDCGCEKCNSSGELNQELLISTKIGPKLFALNYVRQMLSLPGVELAAPPAKPDEKPLLFRFDGGVGAVMPLRGELAVHIEITRQASP